MKKYWSTIKNLLMKIFMNLQHKNEYLHYLLKIEKQKKKLKKPMRKLKN